MFIILFRSGFERISEHLMNMLVLTLTNSKE